MATRIVFSFSLMNRLVACGEQHTVCLSADGTVWRLGSWFWRNKETVPREIRIDAEIVAVDCGATFAVLLDSNHNVWSLGSNAENVLGTRSSNYEEHLPTQVGGLPPISLLSCGAYHTLCVDFDGNVWGFGKCSEGQLGIRQQDVQEVPKKLPVSDIVSASCGSSFSVIQNSNGQVLASGKNKNGQLGIGLSAEQERHEFTLVDIPNVISFSCGDEFVLYADSHGDVYGAGYNYFGQLGVGDKSIRTIPTKSPGISDVVSVSCGKSHSMCVDSYSNLWVFGCNVRGRLGLGDEVARYVPTKVPNLTVSILSRGGCHTIVKDDNGTIWATGRNGTGQLGLAASSYLEFTALQDEHSSIIGIHPSSRAKSARK